MNRKLISPLSIRADVKPGTANDETRTVELTWTTGASVRQYDWDIGEFNEELSLDPKHVRMERIASGRAPLLANHSSRDLSDVLGVIETAGIGNARVRFAKDDPKADQVWNKVKQGVLRSVSVGYRVHKFEKVSDASAKIPTYRAIDWEPYEVSVVALPADAGAAMRSQADTNPCEFITRGMAPHERQHMEPKNETPAPAAPAVDVDKIRAEAVEAERARAAGIRHACRLGKWTSEDTDKLVADAKVTPDKARELVLERLAQESEESPTQSQIGSGLEVGESQRAKSLRGAEAALLQRYGMLELVQKIQDRAKDPAQGVDYTTRKTFADVATDAGEFSGMRPVRIAQEFLERAGKSTRGMSDKRMIEEALTLRSGGEQTASDFSVLLENVMYKQYLGQYELADATWKEFCKVDSVQDFRNANRYRVGSFGALQSKNEAGEFKQMTVPDGLKQVIAAQTKGGIFSVSREALVNDDMGAILATMGEAGNSAGLSIELDVYALLTANAGLGANFTTPTGTQTFFHSSNGNLNGTGSALGVDALETDRVLMAQQKDISGNVYLNLRPSVLLVPVGLGGQAKVINRMEFDNTSSVFQEPNKVRGLFNKVVDTPRLSGTRRYLFSDGAAAIVVAFLNGQRAPYMEQRLGWRVDGTEVKIRIDYGVQFFDPKGAVTNAGT